MYFKEDIIIINQFTLHVNKLEEMNNDFQVTYYH